MVKIRFLLSTLIVFGGWSNADGANRSGYKKEGKTAFDELTHDFGRVRRGEKLIYAFPFQNTGQGPLTIQGVHATCGCTVAEVDTTKVYQPGEKGVIQVTLDTTNFKGHISKSVTVMTNARLLPTRSLTVKAEIEEEVFADPPLLDFGEVHVTAEQAATTKIMIADGSKVTITGLRFDKATLDAQLTPAGDHQMLTVKLKQGMKAGFLKDVVYVKTSSASLKELAVPIRADLLGSFAFQPKYLEFGAIAPDEAVEKEVEITSDGSYKILKAQKQLHVNGFKIENVDAMLTVEPASDGKKMTVKLTNQAEKSGSVHGRLTFVTSDPAQKELMVDFYAFFQRR